MRLTCFAPYDVYREGCRVPEPSAGISDQDRQQFQQIVRAPGFRALPADQKKRAQLTAKAGDLVMQTLPWIPLADPQTVVIMVGSFGGVVMNGLYL